MYKNATHAFVTELATVFVTAIALWWWCHALPLAPFVTQFSVIVGYSFKKPWQDGVRTKRVKNWRFLSRYTLSTIYASTLCTGAYPSCLLLNFNTSCEMLTPLFNVNMKTIEVEEDIKESTKVQWMNMKTGLCYRQQSPMLC